MDPVVCNSCGARFAIHNLSEDDCQQLDNRSSLEEFVEEWQLLWKVQDFYRRHPEAEGKIDSGLKERLKWGDLHLKGNRSAGAPVQQIGLPPVALPPKWVESDEDRRVVEYLQTHSFRLIPRMEFVAEQISELRGIVRAVACLQCRAWELRVPAEHREEFNARNSVTWYRPHRHRVAQDGTLSIKISIYQRFGHGTGEMQIAPENAEYAFWRWLVEQKAYHRPVQDSELLVIREEWSRRE